MKPRLLNLAATVSLLLAIAIVALWMRSYWHDDRVERTKATFRRLHVQMVVSWSSEVSLLSTYVSNPFFVPTGIKYDYAQAPHGRPSQPKPRWFPIRAVWFIHEIGANYDQRGIRIAYWLLLLPTLPLPVIALVRHRRRRHRETNNLCPTCGYDLRATPAKSGPLFDRCPECGTEIPEAAKETT